MTLEYFYTKDRNGDLFISRSSYEGYCPSKDEKEWATPTRICPAEWHKVDEDFTVSIFPEIKIDLKDLPEPSWEDDTPMRLTIKLSYTISYRYEDE